MLELRGVGRNFGGLAALSEVSFHAATGEVTALIGPNGAGKSTLINCATGVDRPDAGEVLLNGQPITGLPAHRVAGLGVARTFQNLRLFPRLSVLDNVLCGLTVKAGGSLLGALLRPPALRNRERRLRLQALAALDRFDLAALADWPVGVLAYGDRKRVELARAVVSEPRLLLLDEPVAGMTDEETMKSAELFLSLAGKYSLIVVEHDMDFVSRIAKTVTVLHEGGVLAEASMDAVQNDQKVIEVYLGR